MTGDALRRLERIEGGLARVELKLEQMMTVTAPGYELLNELLRSLYDRLAMIEVRLQNEKPDEPFVDPGLAEFYERQVPGG